MGNILLLTATVSPPSGVPQLKRVDPQLRLADYSQALAFYCGLLPKVIDRIVFIENSMFDLTPLRAVAEGAGVTDRVEFVSFDGLDHPPAYGRGYGEFKLLDHAMDHSRFLADAAPDDHLWKATGRYRVVNLATMIRTAPATFDVYCDARDRPIPWADLRLLAFTKVGYQKYFHGLYHEFREDQIYMAPERYLRPKVAAWDAADPAVVSRFRREPYVAGVRGLDDQSYRNGKNMLRYLVRAAGRAVRIRL